MKDPIEILERIQPVETPPYLYTRILQQIENRLDRVSKPVAWSLGRIGLVLCVLSLVLLLGKNTPENTDLASGMNLMPHNSLYHD